MTFAPVVVVESGGVPFTQVAEGVGAPAFTVVESGAFAITLVESGGAPIALFNPDGTPYTGVPGPYPAPSGFRWAYATVQSNPTTVNGDPAVTLERIAA